MPTGLIKSWKRRWFRQKADRLYYYETKEETGLKGYIDLTLVNSVSDTPKVKHGFELHTKDRIYYLQAASNEERGQWLDMLSAWYTLARQQKHDALTRYFVTGPIAAQVHQIGSALVLWNRLPLLSVGQAHW